MIESFRLQAFICFPADIKMAEGRKGHFIHIIIHRFQIALHQCFHKAAVPSFRCFKPSAEHIIKHAHRFQIGDTELIPRLQSNSAILHLFRFQITAREQQTPDYIFIVIQLFKHHLLIKVHRDCLSVQ